MIHTSYTVGITTAEYKALQSVTTDQKGYWECYSKSAVLQ